MTSIIFELIGHRLRLTAEGDALTECRWTEESALPSDQSAHDDFEVSILERAKLQLKEYSEGKRTAFDLPLRLKGTDFQMKVWDQLRCIPYGEKLTYAGLARRIGRPKAYRAVANACGANPLPVIIPCHRVVASGGRPGGYTGPPDIKQTLLAIETQE